MLKEGMNNAAYTKGSMHRWIDLIEKDCNCGFQKVFLLPNNFSKLIYVVKL